MNCDGSNEKPDSEIYPNIGAPFDSSHVSVILGCQQTYNSRKKKASASRRRTRLLYILFFVVLLLTASGCVSAADIRPAQDPAEETAAPIISEESSVSIEDQILFDQQGIKVTALSLNREEQNDLSIKVLIGNSTSETKTVTVFNVSVNGVMVDPVFICDVGAGEEINSDILFRESALSDAGIQSIKDIDLQFEIYSDGKTFQSDIISISTTAPESLVQAIDNSGTVVLDQDGIRVVALGLEKEDQSAGDYIYYYYHLNLYIENNSDYNVAVVPDEISINGFMVNSFMYCEVLPGKVAYDKISFTKEVLEYNNIISIENMEFRLDVSDADTFKELVESEVISLTFPN